MGPWRTLEPLIQENILFQKAYNPTSHPTERAALAPQTKIIHSQHSVNSHPIGTYFHIAMIHARKKLADLYSGPNTSIRGRNFHPEGPCVQCSAVTHPGPLPQIALSPLSGIQVSLSEFFSTQVSPITFIPCYGFERALLLKEKLLTFALCLHASRTSLFELSV